MKELLWALVEIVFVLWPFFAIVAIAIHSYRTIEKHKPRD
jgi:hypothetical protein